MSWRFGNLCVWGLSAGENRGSTLIIVDRYMMGDVRSGLDMPPPLRLTGSCNLMMGMDWSPTNFRPVALRTADLIVDQRWVRCGLSICGCMHDCRCCVDPVRFF